MSFDLIAIKARIRNAYMDFKGDDPAFYAALGDVKNLVAEVERLRSTVIGLTEELVEDRTAAVRMLKTFDPGPFGPSETDILSLAARIERGEHRREGDE